MKRSHYQIEGDYISSPHISLDENRRYLGLKWKTLFIHLPVDVLAEIIKHLECDAYTLQQFSRFLFVEFGVSFTKHDKLYSGIKLQLLDMLKERFSLAQPSLFRACKEATLRRIDYCATRGNNHYVVDIDHQFKAIRMILDASHTEIYTLVNDPLCECCTKAFSDSHDEVLLCNQCNRWHYNRENLFKENIVDCQMLQRNPSKQYAWLTESKLKRLCKIKRNQEISNVSFYNRIRQKMTMTRKGNSQQQYLLKDALPFIDAKFKKTD